MLDNTKKHLESVKSWIAGYDDSNEDSVPNVLLMVEWVQEAISLITRQAERLKELTEWRPMETAPKDMTIIQVKRRHKEAVFVDHVYNNVVWMLPVPIEEEDNDDYESIVVPAEELLGWLPLPTPEGGKDSNSPLPTEGGEDGA